MENSVLGILPVFFDNLWGKYYKEKILQDKVYEPFAKLVRQYTNKRIKEKTGEMNGKLDFCLTGKPNYSYGDKYIIPAWKE